MVSFPPCKINLGLHVLGKRPDGYHNLETCFYHVPWTDILEIIPSKRFAFSSSGHNIPGSPEQNLCVKAYQLLAKEFSAGPVQIHLHKILPMGAGLGGGSSDAAHVIRMINEMFSLNLPQERMIQLAASIGSDTSFFIQDRPMLGTGRGEILTSVDVDLEGKFLVLVNPDIHVSTSEAYAHVRPSVPEVGLMDILVRPLDEWRKLLKNDFEYSVFNKYPAIRDIKDKLYSLGALYASMSGSGATVFGIFETEFNVKAEFRDATVWASYL
ncbi:MAG TPA: 4-(cytidine 5'-diphospho)-2-C-methyl-D-erythritol kinase [Chryseolinea sp.]